MALIEKLSAIGDAIRVQSGKTELLTLDQMPEEIINLQSLAFEVVGNPKPDTPKENTIWVDTDVPIGKWFFRETQPDGMEQGDVWFFVGATSPVEFNALKENEILVRPVSASQYVDGTLVSKTAEIYMGGEWKPWVVYIYNLGWVSATKMNSYKANPSGEVGAGGSPSIAVTYSNGEMVLNRTTNWDGYGWTLTDVAFDFTTINTLFCETGSSLGSGDAIRFGIGTSGSRSPKAAITLSQANTVYALDVSSVSGNYNVGFFAGSGSADWNWVNKKIKAFWY